MRVALYARVSTDEQTVAPQLDALRDYAAARRLEVVDEFIDHGVSGSKDRRPAAYSARASISAGLRAPWRGARPPTHGRGASG